MLSPSKSLKKSQLGSSSCTYLKQRLTNQSIQCGPTLCISSNEDMSREICSITAHYNRDTLSKVPIRLQPNLSLIPNIVNIQNLNRLLALFFNYYIFLFLVRLKTFHLALCTTY